MASTILSSIVALTAKLLAFAPSPSSSFLKPPPSSSSCSVTPSFVKQPPSSSSSSSCSVTLSIMEELRKLTTIVQQIQSVIVDAEQKGVKDESIKLWLLELKQVSYDAEDILGDFEFELLRTKMEADRKRKREVFEFDPSSPLYDASLQKEMSHRVRLVCEMFDEIEKERVRFHLVEQDGELKSKPKIRSPTSSLAYHSEVIGRDGEKNEIVVNCLMAPVDDQLGAGDVHVACIVAMGGMGKTTLAKLIYNDQRIVDQFNLRAWTWVFEAHGEVGLLKAAVEAFTGQPYLDVPQVNQLQFILSQIVARKRFLLVLDDVWNEDPTAWESLKAPLRNGLKGSCILITTRSRRVSEVMDAKLTLSLSPLRVSESWALFCQNAFAGDESEAPASLIEKGKAIVEKCKGVPLAIKVLGGLLCFEDDEETWEDVEKSDLWNLDEGKDNILSSLILSYLHLPASLKPCFTYCSVFPKGCYFKQETMVRMWMAQGLLIQPEDNRQMEGIGRSFFNELRRRSLIQDAIPEYFMMHDLIHDSARSIWEKECCIADYEELKGMTECSKTIRHLTLAMTDDISSFEPTNVSGMLRSFLLAARYPIILNVATEMFLKLRVAYLRVLDLSSTGIDELPDSISGLKHLRYLSLTATHIRRLPPSICSLYNLQTLEMRECHSLQELPQDIGNLPNLRHLDTFKDAFSKISRMYFSSQIDDTPMLPAGIGRLTNLQTLPQFMVNEESGYSRLAELKDLNQLDGLLCIVNLQKLVNLKHEAKEANLRSKKNIKDLVLHWRRGDDTIFFADGGDGTNEEDDMVVLEALQPDTNIRSLKLVGYSATRFPSWVGNLTFNCLEEVELSHCNSCQYLPHLSLLPSLKRLQVSYMKILEQWEQVPNDGPEGIYFPCLKELDIDNCYSLTSISVRSLKALEQLQIINCKELMVIGGIDSHSTSLQTLTFKYCSKLQFAEERELPGMLKAICAIKCPLIQEWCQRHRGEFPNVSLRFLPEVVSIFNHLHLLPNRLTAFCQLASLFYPPNFEKWLGHSIWHSKYSFPRGW